MTDANQSFGQNVDQESAEKLFCGNSHDLLLAAVGIILPSERHSIILEANESMVGDRDAVGIAREIMQNMFGAAEGWLGVDDPVLSEELSQKSAEGTWFGESLKRAVELELVLLEELSESRGELASKDATECTDGQEEAVRRSDPSGATGCKATSGNDVMDVGMMLQILPPSMEYAKKSDLGSQMLRITGEFQQCGGAGPEEQIIEQSLVLQSESRELMRQGEDDMKVRHR